MLDILAYAAYLAVIACAAYGLAHGIATIVERLSAHPRKRPHLAVVQRAPSGSLDDALTELKARAGINIEALLAKKVDLAPTPESIALHAKFMRHEMRLRRWKRTRESFATLIARIGVKS